MVQCRRSSRLTPKSLQSLRVLRQIVGKELQRDMPTKLNIFGFVHYSHPAAAQLTKHAIVAEGLAYELRPCRHQKLEAFSLVTVLWCLETAPFFPEPQVLRARVKVGEPLVNLQDSLNTQLAALSECQLREARL